MVFIIQSDVLEYVTAKFYHLFSFFSWSLFMMRKEIYTQYIEQPTGHIHIKIIQAYGKNKLGETPTLQWYKREVWFTFFE